MHCTDTQDSTLCCFQSHYLNHIKLALEIVPAVSPTNVRTQPHSQTHSHIYSSYKLTKNALDQVLHSSSSSRLTWKHNIVHNMDTEGIKCREQRVWAHGTQQNQTTRKESCRWECVGVYAASHSCLAMCPLAYWITQHLHLGFFLMTTCSTCDASLAGTTVPCWTSTGPCDDGFSLEQGAFPLAPTLLPLFCFEAASGADCDTGDTTSTLLAGVATGEEPALWWSAWSGPSEPATDGSLGATLPGVGVIGLPPLIISTISSASRLRSPSGRNGLSHPLSVLNNTKQKER
jgi:hypothetical protein